MTEEEVIIVDQIPQQQYDVLVEKCVRYAIISLPFTVDRMRVVNEKKRTLNIAKGKIAETLFDYFCKANKIAIDFKSCSTPFWKIDKRDFILRNKEWDIKNNFIYCKQDFLNTKYTHLPALIPNRFYGDQWSKRFKKNTDISDGVAFLFTFLKNAALLKNGERGDGFLEILLSEAQQAYLRTLYQKFKGLPQKTMPFTEKSFWEAMQNKGAMNFYRLNFRPPLIVTGYAGKEHWRQFKNTGAYDQANHWQEYLPSGWYQKSARGSCNFLNHTLWTTITNATLPVSCLSSFLSLYPRLKDHIRCGRLRNYC